MAKEEIRIRETRVRERERGKVINQKYIMFIFCFKYMNMIMLHLLYVLWLISIELDHDN
jgi:hypothetical protein